jgi:transposase
MSPEDFLLFLAKQKTLAQRVVMVYEAGPYGYSLYRQALNLGVECLVCAPERMSRGRKRVNDKIDARELLSRLDRHLAGNTTALRLVRVPTLQQEMSRRQARERNTYRKERQRWIARGRSLLHTLGISRPGRWWELDRNQQLKQIVVEHYGQTTADQAWVELDHYLEFIHLAGKHLDESTAQLKEAFKEKQAPRLKGIGPLSSELLDREVGDWSRFSNRRQIASYTGLCPGEDSSGDSRISLSIDKHGNPRLRVVLVELVWLLPRYQPNYKRLARWKWLFEPKSKAPPAMKKKAVVALARQLAVDLWRLRTGRAKPEDLGLTLVA